VYKKTNLSNIYEYGRVLRNEVEKKHFFKNLNINSKFINGFVKNGLKLKSITMLSEGFYNFYSIFYSNNSESSKYTKYADFLVFSKNDSNFFKRVFLIDRIKTLLISSFSLKIEKIPKKYKKLKKYTRLKYSYKICYVPFYRRLNVIIKNVLIHINTLKYFNVVTRFTEAVYNTILEDKASVLYKQKN